jgi:hypothetical protein
MLGCTMLLRYDYLNAGSRDVAFNTPAGQVARPAASALATQNFGLYGGLVTLILGGFSVIAGSGVAVPLQLPASLSRSPKLY